MLCPVFACGVPMSVADPSPTPRPRPALPALRLELRSRRPWPRALASLCAPGAVIAGLLIEGRAALRHGAVPGARRGGGRRGGGEGAGGAAGPGTGDEGGYIFVAAPRTAILPPLKVPGSVAGRTYRVRFWVAADGRVTRVEVEPPIADAAYSREFQRRMLAYQFYPARTRDGRNVAS